MKDMPVEGSARFCKNDYEAETLAANVPICSTEASAPCMQPYPILLRHSLTEPNCAQEERLCKSAA